MRATANVEEFIRALRDFAHCAWAAVAITGLPKDYSEGHVNADGGPSPGPVEVPVFSAHLAETFNKTGWDRTFVTKLLKSEASVMRNTEWTMHQVLQVAERGMGELIVAPPGMTVDQWLIECLGAVEDMYALVAGGKSNPGRYAIQLKRSDFPQALRLRQKILDAISHLSRVLLLGGAAANTAEDGGDETTEDATNFNINAEKERPCWKRDHLWLQWYTARGTETYHSYVNIRHKWNSLPNEERAKICRSNPGRISRDVVITGVKKAQKETELNAQDSSSIPNCS